MTLGLSKGVRKNRIVARGPYREHPRFYDISSFLDANRLFWFLQFASIMILIENRTLIKIIKFE